MSSPIFFDLTASLGTVLRTADGSPSFSIHREAVSTVRAFALQNHRLGAILLDESVSHDEAVGILRESMDSLPIDESLLRSVRLDDAAAIEAMGAEFEAPLFVSPEASRRHRLAGVGFRVTPHPALIPAALRDEALRFVRIGLDDDEPETRRMISANRTILPLLDRIESGPVIYAISTRQAIEAAALSDRTDYLGREGLPAECDLVEVRLAFDSHAQHEYRADLRADLPMVWDLPDGLLLALPGDRSILDVRAPEARHGHATRLSPLKERARRESDLPTVGIRDLPEFRDCEIRLLRETIDPDRYRAYLGPLAGNGSLPRCRDHDSAVQIRSRYWKNPGNPAAVASVHCELDRLLGGRAWTMPFPLGTRTLYNVYGSIQGTRNDSAVLLAAHIDSTCERDTDCAGEETSCFTPGADDDASGVAAVLCAARTLFQLSRIRQPEHSIYFALFNAEEVGMQGSRAFVDWAGLPKIVGMIQVDMIGWNDGAGPIPGAGKRTFEFHGIGPADYSKEKFGRLAPSIDRMGRAIDRSVSTLTTSLAAPQKYPRDFGCGFSPALNSSDHRNFLGNCHPACLISEDLWEDSCRNRRSAGRNPNYHTSTDTFGTIDLEYATEITRAVAGAVWLLAKA